MTDILSQHEKVGFLFLKMKNIDVTGLVKLQSKPTVWSIVIFPDTFKQLSHIQSNYVYSIVFFKFTSMSCYMQWRFLSFRMRCHVLWWLVTNTGERAASITLLLWRWWQRFCVTLLTICLSTCHHIPEDSNVHKHCHSCLISCIRAGSQLWYRSECVKESSVILCLTLWERNVCEKEICGLL